MNGEFTEILSRAEAAAILERLREFIVKYAQITRRQPWAVQRQTYLTFLNDIVTTSSQDALFVDFVEKYSKDGLQEVWEKLISTRIHSFVFAIHGSDDFKLDFILDHRITMHGWIEERHLDLPFSVHQDVMDMFSREMAMLNKYRAPKDKLIILQNSIQILMNFIEAQGDVNVGNDNLLPLLIYAIIHCNPTQLMSNIKYIRRFRHPSKLEEGIVAYYLTTVLSAISFICNLKLDALTITAEEKLERMQQMKAMQDELLVKRRARQAPKPMDFGDMASKALDKATSFVGRMAAEVKNLGESAVGKLDQALHSNEPVQLLPDQGPQSSRFTRNVSPLFGENSESPNGASPDDLSPKEQTLLDDYDLALATAMSLSLVDQSAAQQPQKDLLA